MMVVVVNTETGTSYQARMGYAGGRVASARKVVFRVVTINIDIFFLFTLLRGTIITERPLDIPATDFGWAVPSQ